MFVPLLFSCVLLFLFVVSHVLANHLRLCNTKQQQQTNKQTNNNKHSKHKQHILGVMLGEGVVFWEGWFVLFEFWLFVFVAVCNLFVLYLLCCAFFFSLVCPLSSLITFAFAMQKQQQHKNKQTKRNPDQNTYNKLGCYLLGVLFGGMFWYVRYLFVCFCCYLVVVICAVFVVLCVLTFRCYVPNPR